MHPHWSPLHLLCPWSGYVPDYKWCIASEQKSAYVVCFNVGHQSHTGAGQSLRRKKTSNAMLWNFKYLNVAFAVQVEFRTPEHNWIRIATPGLCLLSSYQVWVSYSFRTTYLFQMLVGVGRLCKEQATRAYIHRAVTNSRHGSAASVPWQLIWNSLLIYITIEAEVVGQTFRKPALFWLHCCGQYVSTPSWKPQILRN
jgi:hypothetical protein